MPFPVSNSTLHNDRDRPVASITDDWRGLSTDLGFGQVHYV